MTRLPGASHSESSAGLAETGAGLDPRAERGMDQALRLAVGALRVPVALVGLYAGDGSIQIVRLAESGVWEPISGTTAAQSLAGQVGSAVAAPAHRGGATARGRLSVGQLGVVEYAALPLVVGESLAGVFAVIDRRQREWGPDQDAMLRDIAGVVAGEVEWHRERLAGAPAARHTLEALQGAVERLRGEMVVRKATDAGIWVDVFLPAATGEPANTPDGKVT